MTAPRGFAYWRAAPLVCISCGAAVYDTDAHARWHGELVEVLTEIAEVAH